MKEIQKLFPSMDGNELQREELLSYFKTILTKIDEIKDPNKLTLGKMPEYTEDYYNRIIEKADVPKKGVSMEEVIQELLKLAEGHRYVNRNYVANAAPLTNIASMIGNFSSPSIGSQWKLPLIDRIRWQDDSGLLTDETRKLWP